MDKREPFKVADTRERKSKGKPVAVVIGATSKWQADGRNTRLIHGKAVDDSIAMVGVHMIGGLTGTLLIGFLATKEAPAAVDGLFYGDHSWDQLWRQARGGSGAPPRSASAPGARRPRSSALDASRWSTLRAPSSMARSRPPRR